MNRVHEWLKVLELEPGATFDDIRRAHRDMAKVWHPDRFPNDKRLREKAEEHQKAINEAFGNLEEWVKSGQSLPAIVEMPSHAPPVPHVPGVTPPVHKKHPMRDTWTIRPPLGVDEGYKRSPSRAKPIWPLVLSAVVLFGLVAAAVVVLGF